MDNVCHTLAGAVLGEAGMKQRTALGTVTLMAASNLPDIDVLVFATDTLAMSFRRGWTHGIVAQLLLPPVLALLVFAWDRARRRAQTERATLAGLLLLSYLGTWLHIFMDWLNSYGVRLLKPFSDRWFYGDALYIVDPVLYVVLGGALLLARRRHPRAPERARRVARVGLAVAAIYMVAMLGSNWWARAEVRAGLRRAGGGHERFMVTPVFANPFRRDVVVERGDRYERGQLWFDPLPHFRPAGFGVDTNCADPAALAAARLPRVQAYLQWSRFPFFVIDQTAARTLVIVNDYRYAGASGRDGWAALTVAVPAGQ